MMTKPLNKAVFYRAGVNMIGYSSPDWGMGGWYTREDTTQALEEEVEARVDEMIEELDLMKLEALVSVETWEAIITDLSEAAEIKILEESRR